MLPIARRRRSGGRHNGRVSDPFDEFSFLPAQAADAGIAGPLPLGERLTLTLADGRSLSALRYDPRQARGTEGAARGPEGRR